MLSVAKFVYLLCGAYALEVETRAWTEAGVQQLAGAVLDGQYVLEAPVPGTLQEFEAEGLVEVDAKASLERGGMVRAERNVLEAHGNPPREITDKYSNMHYLRSGSFGEAWTAHDRGKKVVIKIFYTKTSTGIRYLSRKLIARSRSLNKAVDEAVQECTLANKIATLGPSTDPGKDRVVKCLKNEAGHSRPESAALYLVLEHGGTSIEEWIKDNAYAATVDEKRKVVGHLLQGLRTMGELLPEKLVHHDLKPANSVYDGTTARLIDFGGTMVGTPANKYANAVASMAYAPPEFLGTVPGRAKVAFEVDHRTLAVSFDMYAMGMIYVEIMCGGMVTFPDIYLFARSQIKSTRQLEQILAGRSCRISSTDLTHIMGMLAFYAKDRPTPSQVLNAEPFSRPAMQDLLGEVPEDLEASVDGAADLAASIVPKDEDNPNVRGGRGAVYRFDAGARDLSGWESKKQCQFAVRERRIIDTDDPVWKGGGSTRAICEEKCIATEKKDDERAIMYGWMKDSPDKSKFCCQLNVRDDGSGANALRTCDYGWGDLVPFSADGRADKITAWARHLPFSQSPVVQAEPDMPLNLGRGAAQRQFAKGDQVRVRDHSNMPWRQAVVVKVTADGDVKCRVNGKDRDYTYKYVEKLMSNHVRAEAPVVRPSNAVASPMPANGGRRPSDFVMLKERKPKAKAKPKADSCEAKGGSCKYLCDSSETNVGFGLAGCPAADFCCVQRQCEKDGHHCRSHCERGEEQVKGDGLGWHAFRGAHGCEEYDYCCKEPVRSTFKLNQRVRVRDDPSTWHQAGAFKEWRFGSVHDPHGPRVLVDGLSSPFKFDQVEAVEERAMVAGAHVQMKNYETEFDWHFGILDRAPQSWESGAQVRDNRSGEHKYWSIVYPIEVNVGKKYEIRQRGMSWEECQMINPENLIVNWRGVNMMLNEDWQIQTLPR